MIAVLRHLGGVIMRQLQGCFTAMVTPFDASLEVDYKGLKENVEFQIKNGIAGLVPLGTTGESPTIEDAERTKILKTVITAVKGRVPVIVGVGTNSTAHTIDYAKEADSLGADGILVVSPYYNKPSQEGLFRHYEAVTKAVNIPLVVYNIQGRTSVNIETRTLERIGRLRNVVGVKEASGSMAQVQDVIKTMPGDFTVLSGEDNVNLPILALGGRGTIAVASNLLPKRFSDLINAALSSNFARAREINDSLVPLLKAFQMDTNPVPIKTAMQLAGMPAGGVRLPLYEMAEDRRQRLKEVLLQYKELRLK
jgi:4-hydroxy-tetrahydrodipicolinate synthase